MKPGNEFNAQVSAAESRVKAMDSVDGFPDRHLKTILFALEAGLRTDLGCAFDAYVMLRDRVNQEAGT